MRREPLSAFGGEFGLGEGMFGGEFLFGAGGGCGGLEAFSFWVVGMEEGFNRPFVFGGDVFCCDGDGALIALLVG
ncbi:hypothetical protein ACQ86N_24265 [Puia sp. P3]|uniref:hypothetical protein n=1 Tax=Puia sp. P3 TaxID=3423952 RepID=UPI003D664B7C